MTQISQNTIFSSIYDTYLLDILDQDQLTLLPGARGLLIEGYIYRYSIGMYVVNVGYLPSYYHHTTYNHVLMPPPSILYSMAPLLGGPYIRIMVPTGG